MAQAPSATISHPLKRNASLSLSPKQTAFLSNALAADTRDVRIEVSAGARAGKGSIKTKIREMINAGLLDDVEDSRSDLVVRLTAYGAQVASGLRKAMGLSPLTDRVRFVERETGGIARSAGVARKAKKTRAKSTAAPKAASTKARSTKAAPKRKSAPRASSRAVETVVVNVRPVEVEQPIFTQSSTRAPAPRRPRAPRQTTYRGQQVSKLRSPAERALLSLYLLRGSEHAKLGNFNARSREVWQSLADQGYVKITGKDKKLSLTRLGHDFVLSKNLPSRHGMEVPLQPRGAKGRFTKRKAASTRASTRPRGPEGTLQMMGPKPKRKGPSGTMYGTPDFSGIDQL